MGWNTLAIPKRQWSHREALEKISNFTPHFVTGEIIHPL